MLEEEPPHSTSLAFSCCKDLYLSLSNLYSFCTDASSMMAVLEEPPPPPEADTCL